MHLISRIDDDRTHTHAWLVRVQRRNRMHHRCFSDRVHGGNALGRRDGLTHCQSSGTGSFSVSRIVIIDLTYQALVGIRL